jgi:hypothetical protein
VVDEVAGSVDDVDEGGVVVLVDVVDGGGEVVVVLATDEDVIDVVGVVNVVDVGTSVVVVYTTRRATETAARPAARSTVGFCQALTAGETTAAMMAATTNKIAAISNSQSDRRM